MRTAKTSIVAACALAGVLALAGCAQTPATPAKEQAGTQNRETMFQVSLLQSLTEGDFEGSVTVGELKKHGDTGIGTFAKMNVRSECKQKKPYPTIVDALATDILTDMKTDILTVNETGDDSKLVNCGTVFSP